MVAPDPTLEVLWKRVLDDWEDEATHSAFVDYCQRTGRLVDAAVRYRGMCGDRSRAPASEKKLKAIALLAMAELEVVRQDERRTPTRIARLVLLFAFFLATFGLMAYVGFTR